MNDCIDNVTASKIPVRLSDLWRVDEAGELTVFTEAQYHLAAFSTAGVGAAVWLLCDGTKSVSDIVATVYEGVCQHGASPGQVSADCLAFFDSLRAATLIGYRGEIHD
jgi:hypothetical protein